MSSSTLTARQQLLLSEMQYDEDVLKELAYAHDFDYGSQVGHGYAELEIAINNQIANAAYLPVGDVGKRNPYVAGGIAQGIAGPAAGLYTALKTDQQNAEADRENARRHEANARNVAERPYVQMALSQAVNSLDSLLNRYDDMRAIRKKWMDARYGAAKHELEELERSLPTSAEDLQKLAKVKNTFAGLSYYYPDAKDFQHRVDECLSEANNRLAERKARYVTWCKWAIWGGLAAMVIGAIALSLWPLVIGMWAFVCGICILPQLK